jgi:RNA polymerase sigma factor (sigma-70 family)
MAATGRTIETLDKDLVGAYLDAIGRTPLLDAEQEVELSKEIEAGLFAQQLLDEDRVPADASREELLELVERGLRAKQRFVEANLRLVVSIARKYPTDSLPFIDLIQEGNLGLMRAVEKFDYRRGFKFSTYATWWIRQAIGRGLSHTARAIRLPVHVEEELSRLRRTERTFSRDLGREPTSDELAAALGASTEHVADLLRWRRDPASLDASVDEAGETAMGDLLEDTETIDPETEVMALDDLAGLDKLLDRLPPREAEIVRARFGLDDGEPLSYAQIGARYGLSHNRVRQITDRSLRRLRQMATEDGFVPQSDRTAAAA